jgi:phosphohistidine phosphatase SixA
LCSQLCKTVHDALLKDSSIFHETLHADAHTRLNAGLKRQAQNQGMNRRHLLRRVAAASSAFMTGLSAADGAAWDGLKKPGAIVLFRHALAPGGGDPPGFVPGDCSTQRNLSDEGQVQAKRIGQALQAQGVKVQAVWHSEWCRTRDTAHIAFPELQSNGLRPEPAFNSFFADRRAEPMQTAAAKQLLLKWRGPGTLVVVTHQVNIRRRRRAIALGAAASRGGADCALANIACLFLSQMGQ